MNVTSQESSFSAMALVSVRSMLPVFTLMQTPFLKMVKYGCVANVKLKCMRASAAARMRAFNEKVQKEMISNPTDQV